MTDHDGQTTVLGLMAGTSVDGIDAVMITTDGQNITRTGHALTTAYEKSTIEAIFQRFDDPFADDDLAMRVARDHARAAEMLIAKSGIMPDLIGFHGQTVYHAPEDKISLQIGDAHYLAQRLGAPVIHDFRQNDLAHGGQGAPLAPIYHQALIKALHLPLPAALVNIGGISNASIVKHNIQADGDDDLIGLDLGPGNALMDDLARRHLNQSYDKDGAFAAGGTACESLVDAMMTNTFFTLKGPKSLDRNGLYDLIPQDELSALSEADRMATFIAMTARAIVAGVTLNCPDIKAIVICGGGSLNPALMAAIKTAADGVDVSRSDDHMLGGMALDSRFIEAELIAYLAMRSQRGLPITFPATTGVDQPRTGGVRAKVKLK